jgi:hypothetical protein
MQKHDGFIPEQLAWPPSPAGKAASFPAALWPGLFGPTSCPDSPIGQSAALDLGDSILSLKISIPSFICLLRRQSFDSFLTFLRFFKCPTLAISCDDHEICSVEPVKMHAEHTQDDVDIAAAEAQGKFPRVPEKWLSRITNWGIELRGVAPIPLEERTDSRFINVFFVWFTLSTNLLPYVYIFTL